jgi:MerR family copper efflux transcriptional regulator
MNIGEAAKQSGLSSKTIRYYESIDLIVPSARRDNGYREYSESKVQELIFLRHARQFGFALDECKQLLALYTNPGRQSRDVHNLVAEKLADIELRIAELKNMKRVLEEMSGQCPNDEGAACAILDNLARPDEEPEQ